jgi:creatinine amidohydrolase
MSDEVQLQRMTWPEIEAAIAAGKRTAVIVAASSEQHGPHLPEATDELLGEAIGIRLAHKLGDALLAPVIRPGCSDHHMAFPGTITISPQLMMELLDAHIASLAKHGFQRFIVFSSHGGNFPVLAKWQERGVPDGVIVVTDLDGFAGTMLKALRPFGRNDTTIPHGDASETGEMLYVHPELVKMDRAAKGFEGEIGLPELQRSGLRAVTANGVLGDPVGATAKMGEAVMNALVEHLMEVVSRRPTA